MQPLDTHGSAASAAMRPGHELGSSGRERLRGALLQLGSTLVWFCNPDGALTGVWGWEDFCGELGRSRSAITGWIDAIHAGDRDMVREAWRQARVSGALTPFDARFVHAQDGYRWAQIRAVAIRDETGAVTEWIGTVTDVDEHRRAAAALRESELRLRLAMQTTGLGIWELELSNGECLWTPEARLVAGIGPDIIPDQDLFYRLVHPDDLPRVSGMIDRLIGDREFSSYDVTYRLRRPDNGQERWIQEWGRVINDDAGLPLRIVGAVKDVHEVKMAEQRLIHAVNHDVLTGLLNRGSLYAELDRAIQQALEECRPVALLLADIDDFKEVNDTLGHDAGDALLTVAAARFVELFGRGSVGRLGGDEFAVVLSRHASAATIREAGEQILRRLAEPFTHRGRLISIRASIGIACYPEHAGESDNLLKDADLALYEAKREGRHRVCLYRPGMRDALEQRGRLMQEVRQALGGGLFEPFYQPKVDLATGQVVGFEALARWRHPTRGLLTPGVFGAAFEDAQAAQALDASILAHVARDLGGWLRQGLPCGRVAVNVSSYTLRTPGIVKSILGQLADARVPADRLQIEVTESVFIDRRAVNVGALMRSFREHGIRISLDDFGTGYASLVHLTRFPVDELKIDQSFVRDLEQNRHNAAIVSAVIGLGRDLGMVIVAEGIELVAQAETLRQWGCGVGQGYLFGRPMPGRDVDSFLSAKGLCPLDPHQRPAAFGNQFECGVQGQSPWR